METKAQKNVLGWKETFLARIAEHALEKELQGFSESPGFTLCCFSTNAKMLTRFNTEKQHRASKPEITKCSLRDVKTAALSLTHRETEACAETWRKAISQTSRRARYEPPQVIWIMCRPVHHAVSPSWLTSPSERVIPAFVNSCLLYSSRGRVESFFSSFCNAVKIENERRTMN